MNKTSRINKLRAYMEKDGPDSFIITDGANVFYLSGFTGSNGNLIITAEKQVLITDFRYIEQAKQEAPDFEISITNTAYSWAEAIRDVIGPCTRIGIENRSISLSKYNEISNSLGIGKGKELIYLEDILTEIRAIKDKGEIEHIAHAASIADMAFEYIIGILKAGVSEREIAIELEFYMRKMGAEGMSFDPIVASGIRGSMPHAKPCDKLIEKGDFVTMDFGCKYKGYCSDMTRTVVVGTASERQRHIYNVVLNAQKAALKEIKPGVLSHDVDMIARNIIKLEGYENYFGHGLGHGVGVEIHELPRLNQKAEDGMLLKAGMVLTDEPGIYIPDFGGVRIEDLIVVTNEGSTVLSHSTKELLEIN